MKKMLLLFCLFSICVSTYAGEVLEKLKQIPQIKKIEELKVPNFNEYYLLWFEQPVNHENLSEGVFLQRVMFGHKNLDANIVVELEGYGIYSKEENELTKLFNTNQIVIEHRFFNESVPEGAIPWKNLRIKQAATDQHKIIQAIKTYVYGNDNKWISTGISKGGQTTIFHRYFYPDDVEISVPYVAPLNLEYVDPRLEKFMNNVGRGKSMLSSIFGAENTNSAHFSIVDFQKYCFEHINDMLKMFTDYTSLKSYTYNRVGGEKRALELMILEYPFAFWQWGQSAASIPEEHDDVSEFFEHLVKVSDPTFFEDKSVEAMMPFFYAALIETGMYEYNVRPFRKYLKDKENIRFDIVLSDDARAALIPFNDKQMKDIAEWLQTDAEKMLFVYGGIDPWGATAVDLGKNDKCKLYLRADMDHKCRINSLDPASREDAIATIAGWLE